jgi:recombination protein U
MKEVDYLATNAGKKFEEDFKLSCDKVSHLFVYRFRDGSSSWGGNEKVRFQATNICDFMVFYNTKLLLLELKSVLKKSLPLGNIKTSQIEGLTKAFNKNASHMFIGFLVNFRDYEETYFMSIEQFNNYISNEERKSIPLEYFRSNCVLVKQDLKKVRYSYHIEDFLNELK